MSQLLSGLSVLTPTATWALLTILIPVLIHLFNRSRGRLVRIGHIDLVRKARKSSVTEVKLKHWLLLLLRIAIFTLAALILAGLSFPGREGITKPAIYVTPAWLSTSSPEQINKLLGETREEQGAGIFELRPGFPELDKQRLERRQNTALEASEITNAWPLLAERLSTRIHDVPVKVYATDFNLQYGKTRPELSPEISWHLSHPDVTPRVPAHSIHAVIASDQDRSSEAVLLREVLGLLKEHRMPGLSWEMTEPGQINDAHLNADWLFLLSDHGISPAQLSRINTPTVVLSDADAGPTHEIRQYVRLPFYPFSEFRLERITEARHFGHSRDQDIVPQALLNTTRGDPVFEEFSFGDVRLLQFNSRLDPAWSSLTQQVEFPELLMSLMLGDTLQALRYADARIDPGLLQNTQSDAGGIDSAQQSLQGLLALLLTLLWIIERWLSERKTRETL